MWYRVAGALTEQWPNPCPILPSGAVCVCVCVCDVGCVWCGCVCVCVMWGVWCVGVCGVGVCVCVWGILINTYK